ncbi:MAG: TonB-dependent receptor domain-containing protein, partial [Gemmatimonadaceae bacterium]
MPNKLGQHVPPRSLLAVCLTAGAMCLLGVPGAHAQGVRAQAVRGEFVRPVQKLMLTSGPSSVTVVSFAHGASNAAVQSGTLIVGQVTDTRTKQGVPGVSVQVEGTRFGTITGDDGRFQIANVPVGSHTLIVRRLGYTPGRQTVTVTNEQQVAANFALAAVGTSLDQVVITGTVAGEQRRSIGNVVSTINATEAISKSAAQSVSSLIGARAPGVIIAPTTGRLGAGPSIQIRGRSSIGLDNSPLIYIDGVRVNNATNSGPIGNGGFGGQGSNTAGRLNDISPEDIESIEIIKGPAAPTIYGTEAANGVIQIITKKGAGGKARFNLQVQNGSIWFRDAENRVATNYVKDKTTGDIVAWNGVKTEAALGTPLFKTGQTRVYNGALSGGSNSLSYYVSGVYENDLGIEPNNTIRQYTSHANLNVTPNPRLDFGTSLNFVNLSNRLGADVGVSSLFGAEFGHGTAFPKTRGFFLYPPEVPQTLYDNAQGVTRFTGSETINHRPTSWFSQRLIAGVDYTGDDSRAIERFAPPDLAAILGPVAAAGRIQQTLRRNTIISTDYSGTAKFNLTSALSSASSIGGQFYRTELNVSGLGGTGFPGPGVETVSAVSTPTGATQTQLINTTIGAYGQEQLGWHDRLFLTGGLRVDNNSAFGSNFKLVTYPKFSAAWVVSEEPFWRENRLFNSLKLRAAYGESGRQPAAFSALQTFSPAQGPGGTSAVTPNSIGNVNLRPERGKEIELGFESQMFSRLNLDFTYFSKRTFDEIIAQ